MGQPLVFVNSTRALGSILLQMIAFFFFPVRSLRKNKDLLLNEIRTKNYLLGPGNLFWGHGPIQQESPIHLE